MIYVFIVFFFHVNIKAELQANEEKKKLTAIALIKAF